MSRMHDQKTRQEELYLGKPDWYWVYGLHDAEILEVNELELPPDWKSKDTVWNCLEITLDSRGALFDTSVCKIALYNYKILSRDVRNFDKRIWWMGDSISGKEKDYLLNVEFEEQNGNRFQMQIQFQKAVVDRK